MPDNWMTKVNGIRLSALILVHDGTSLVNININFPALILRSLICCCIFKKCLREWEFLHLYFIGLEFTSLFFLVKKKVQLYYVFTYYTQWTPIKSSFPIDMQKFQVSPFVLFSDWLWYSLWPLLIILQYFHELCHYCASIITTFFNFQCYIYILYLCFHFLLCDCSLFSDLPYVPIFFMWSMFLYLWSLIVFLNFLL